PIGLTLYVVSVLLDLMGKFIQPAIEYGLAWLWHDSKTAAPDFTAGLYRQLVVVSSAVVMLCILVVVGYLSKRLFGKILHRWFATVLERIPGLGSLYGTIRQMVDALSGRNKDTFRRVVMVEFPRPGMWSIAFVTHEQPTVFSQAIGKPVVNIFIPAAPAPGYAERAASQGWNAAQTGLWSDTSSAASSGRPNVLCMSSTPHRPRYSAVAKRSKTMLS
ncbi:MAG: DUF502 domain-containing protein, partial [Actinobacteria bacterium]|nr:DUF502 domain-containing protein [Actinomycetota bacterium]